MTTLQVPAIGYGIRYEFGIFEQQIQNGQQIEVTDKWLQNGNPWEIVQHNVTYKVKFGGHTQTVTKPNGQYEVQWISTDEVKGIAYDTPVPGYKNDAINLLRLWKARSF
jgi:starch phosphorylase